MQGTYKCSNNFIVTLQFILIQQNIALVTINKLINKPAVPLDSRFFTTDTLLC